MIDLILYKANIVTMDVRKPRAELVAISGGRIIGLGENDDLLSFKKAKTKVIDCKGKTLVPGFHDAHCHVLALAHGLLSVDCTPASVKSIRDIKAKLSDYSQRTTPGTWIVATGYDEFHLAERRHPTCWDLDEATPHHPVKLNHRSGHACVLNSLALQLAGISRETPDPPGGLIDRALETGEPTGLLFEMNYDVDKVIPPLTGRDLEQGIKLANHSCLSSGVTSFQDATADNDFQRWQIFQQFKSRGLLSSRMSMMVSSGAMSQFIEQGILPWDKGEQLSLGAVKMILDETTGSLYPPIEEVKRQVLQAHQAGFQVALHAIEENAIKAAASALEFALSISPRPINPRHRIEHCSVCPPPLVERLKNIGAVVVTQPAFLYYSGERYLAEVSPAELRWLYRLKYFWENSLMPAASSDSPVVPLNPLVGIYAAVTRKAKTGQVILAEECLPAEWALAMYTSNAAYVTFEEEMKGTISQGKLADLVVLSDDPTQVPTEEIKKIQTLMTIINGRIVWEKSGFS